MFDPLVSKEELKESIKLILSTSLKNNESRFAKKLRLIPNTDYYCKHKEKLQIYKYNQKTNEYVYKFHNKDIQNIYNKYVNFEKKNIDREYFLQALKRNSIGSEAKEISFLLDELKSLREEDMRYLIKLLYEK
jgi:hypothetical protein